MRTLFASFFVASLVAFVPACSGSASNEPSASSEDDLSASVIFGCHVDSDCVAVPKEECCPSGRKEAVNKHHVVAYEHKYACKQKPQVCPLFMILDTRVAECNASTNKCEMVAITDIQCGGFVMNPHTCPPGYDCLSGPTIGRNPDLPGECAPHTCVQNQMCVQGDHWDSTLCKCVP
jgi:hypothetical protein